MAKKATRLLREATCRWAIWRAEGTPGELDLACRLVEALEGERREYGARCRPLVEAAARAQEIIAADELEAGIVREPSARYAGDPRWITTRYSGPCRRCWGTVAAGTRAFYYPHGRTLLCEACGGPAASEFEEAARLEASGAYPW